MTNSIVTIFCDDIRQESNGKQILIGVYGRDLVPAQLPMAFPLSVWIRLGDVSEGLYRFNFALWTSKDQKIVGAEGEIAQTDNEPFLNLNFVGMPIQMEKPGYLIAKLSFAGIAEKEIGRLRISDPSPIPPFV